MNAPQKKLSAEAGQVMKAVELIQQRQFGYMASLRGTEIVAVPIEEALSQKLLDPKVFDDAAVFFG